MKRQPTIIVSTAAADAAPPERILRVGPASEMVGLSPVTMWRLRRRGLFPEPVELSDNLTGYLESDLQRWIMSRPRYRTGGGRRPTEDAQTATGAVAPETTDPPSPTTRRRRRAAR